MTRNLKVLGLALVAVFAMSAVVSSAAQAKFHTLTTFPTTESVIFTGSALATQEFAVGSKATVKCSEVSLEKASVNTDKSTSITAYPLYNKTENTCEVSPFGKGTVHMNGCYYTFTSETDVNGLAEVHVVCPPEKVIEITGPAGCTIKVGTQTVRGVKYANKGEGETGMYIEVTPEVTGIAYTSTGACQLIGIKASASDGTYKGAVKATADKINAGGEPGEAVGITTSTLKEGEAMP
jgi:hypothetical protein